jgi:hypothetical protein
MPGKHALGCRGRGGSAVNTSQTAVSNTRPRLSNLFDRATMPPYQLLLSLALASSRVLVNAANPSPVEDYDVLQYVDPLIGSANGGKLEQLAIGSSPILMIVSTQEMSSRALHYHTAWQKPLQTQTQKATKAASPTKAAM